MQRPEDAVDGQQNPEDATAKKNTGSDPESSKLNEYAFAPQKKNV